MRVQVQVTDARLKKEIDICIDSYVSAHICGIDWYPVDSRLTVHAGYIAICILVYL